ncbi:MAG: lysophospholipid acyltransferase family protein [Oceanicoccus sp.]
MAMLKLIGWRVVGEVPSDPKYIVVAAPHTSNWDFPVFIFAVFVLRLHVHWMGKDSLFPFPFKWFVAWFGGIPVDRSKTNNVVEEIANYFSQVKELVVVIPPEGTRKKVKRWKTGFYHIADRAGIPIALGFVDGKTKTVGLGPSFLTTGDIDADMKSIQAFYSEKQGINQQNF